MSQPGSSPPAVVYPCSDGQPMAETDLHRVCIVYVCSALRWHFERRGRTDVYVSANSYLSPPLQGHRLDGGEYRPLPAVTMLPGRGVAIRSEVLGLDLRDERKARMLRLHDPETGQDLLTYQESERARAEEAAARRAAEARVVQEMDARRAVGARTAELEARLRRLENTAPLPKPPRSR